jgi:predicted short-subunit dehydrogenase-like oxidoreductase (DUF2520 family)
VGRSFGVALRQAGFRIGGLTSKDAESARAACALIGAGQVVENLAAAARLGDIVFITVPDSVVAAVCDQIAAGRGFHKGQVVFHCSGALSAEALASARRLGAAVGALHPLQSFAGAEDAAQSMRGVVFAFQGDAEAAMCAHTLVEKLGGRLFAITAEGKPLYHAASVFASNYFVAVAQVASSLLAESGVPDKDALKALLPLMRGTLDNLEKVGLPNALTGPIARGDVKTVEMHLAALGRTEPLFERAYRELGLVTLRIAREKGTLTPEQASQIDALLRS